MARYTGALLAIVVSQTGVALADDLQNAATPEAAEPPATPPPTQPIPSYVPPAPQPPATAPSATAPAPQDTGATSPAPPVVYPPNTAPTPGPAPAPAPGAPPPATGQWVYTTQYGWVWMPYERAYTYVSPAADRAYAYVYYPVVGWRWVWAPWILSVGPAPYWGAYGRARFVWYAHPWFHPRYVPRARVVVHAPLVRPRYYRGGGYRHYRH